MRVHRAVRAYLDRVERETLDRPWAERRELLAELEQRLMRRLGPNPTDDEVNRALARLGPPEHAAAGRRRRGRWWSRLI
jgi:hypothetical protein